MQRAPRSSAGPQNGMVGQPGRFADHRPRHCGRAAACGAPGPARGPPGILSPGQVDPEDTGPGQPPAGRSPPGAGPPAETRAASPHTHSDPIPAAAAGATSERGWRERREAAMVAALRGLEERLLPPCSSSFNPLWLPHLLFDRSLFLKGSCPCSHTARAPLILEAYERREARDPSKLGVKVDHLNFN
eukprot:767912-Hanusia_phi.AAC.5